MSIVSQKKRRSFGIRTGGVYLGGSIEAVNTQGLESLRRTLSAPQSSLSISTEQASPHHGTPLPASLLSEHGSRLELSASNSSSSESSGAAASGQPSGQTLENQTPLEVSHSDKSTCSDTTSNEQAPRSVNDTQSHSPPGDDAGHPWTAKPELEPYYHPRGEKGVPGSLLSRETLRDSPSQVTVQAQDCLDLRPDDDDSSRLGAPEELRVKHDGRLPVDPRRPIIGSSRDGGTASESQDEDLDLDADIQRVIPNFLPPPHNHPRAVENGVDTESVDAISSGPAGSNQVSNVGSVAQPGDPDDSDPDDSEEGDNEGPNEDSDLLQQFKRLVTGQSDSECDETDTDRPVVSRRGRHISFLSFDDDSLDEEYEPPTDEEISEDEVAYITDVYDTDAESADETEPTVPAVPASLTNGRPSTTNASGRRRLTSKEREVVRRTREMGACVRCRFQKIKCQLDESNPTGECETCKKVSKTSPKTIHRIPCLRVRIADIILYRTGGLNLTRRWTGIEMRDIGDRLGTKIVTIEVSQNLCGKPLRINVVPFKPRDGDVTARYWTDCHFGKETFKKKELATYCLENIYDTAESVRQYTIDNALPAFIHTTKEERVAEQGDGGPIFRTYSTAMRRYMELHVRRLNPDKSSTLTPSQEEHKSGEKLSVDDAKELEIFGNLFILWCAIRSLYIEGKETLGMLPETEDKSYPLYGKVSVPRMIVAQFDTLVYNEVLERYKEKLLRDIDWLFNQDKKRWWFTVYLVVFILLREGSRMTADRYRHARANYGSKLRYSIPEFVEGLHASCNNILAHWHYYNCNQWPASRSKKHTNGLERRDHFETLEPRYLELVRQSRKDRQVKKHLYVWKRYKADNGKVPKTTLQHDAGTIRYTGQQNKYDWDHPLYWVSQMFEKNWFPHDTYKSEPVPRTTLIAVTTTVAAAG
ncbi:hypothetical protein IL306_005359 [Fusarium sp. DS 682]|nr:hypothetical protein IL306_005359 [Fusarium sp. DS 682]